MMGSCIFHKMDGAYLLLVLFLLIWCFIHSALLSVSATHFFKRKSGPNFRFFRAGYNLFAVASIISVMMYSRALRTQPFFERDGLLMTVRFLLLGVSCLFFFSGAQSYNIREFLGISFTGSTSRSPSQLPPSHYFQIRGVNKIVRHPWYFAALLIIWSRPIDISVICENMVFSLYLIVGTFLEERKLIQQFGKQYRLYQRKVPMLLPVNWLHQIIRKVVRPQNEN